MTVIHQLLPREVDCLVLGGGITGAGVARDAAMRGWRVMLVDSHDFASGTSHLTSKLIHGGFRYLEHGHIRPVIEGVIERDRLLNHLAPNLVRPLRFVMPCKLSYFPKWLACIVSLQLYGFTEWWRSGRWSAGRFAPGLRKDCPLVRSHPFSISFWDAQTNDARLVMASLRSAACEGASIWNYMHVTDARFAGDVWTVSLRSKVRGLEWTLRAKMIVNATGPWSPMTAKVLGIKPMNLMWIKGTHILLNRPASFGDDAIVIRSIRDRRPLWAVPWENRLVVGSTESRFTDDPRLARPTADEIEDLFESMRNSFPKMRLRRSDITCAFAGVRPIVAQDAESENSLSRHHRVDVDDDNQLITLNGGKLTTFRLMAEQTMDAATRMLHYALPDRTLRRRLRHDPLWPMMSTAEASELTETLERRKALRRVPRDIITHVVNRYGSDAVEILSDATYRPRKLTRVIEDLPVTLSEIGYLCRNEKVCHLLDILKRRTSLYFLSRRGGMEHWQRVVEHVAPILEWDARRCSTELDAVADECSADMQALQPVAERADPKEDVLTACA